MVQMVENRAVLEGTVTGVDTHSAFKGHGTVTMRVDRSRDIHGFPNFLQDRVGEEVQVAVPREVFDTLKRQRGEKVALPSRLGGDSIFALPES